MSGQPKRARKQRGLSRGEGGRAQTGEISHQGGPCDCARYVFCSDTQRKIAEPMPAYSLQHIEQVAGGLEQPAQQARAGAKPRRHHPADHSSGHGRKEPDQFGNSGDLVERKPERDVKRRCQRFPSL